MKWSKDVIESSEVVCFIYSIRWQNLDGLDHFAIFRRCALIQAHSGAPPRQEDEVLITTVIDGVGG